MNYIKLLVTAHQKIIEDQRLNATHVSLYFSLFQQWNSSYFSKTFFINRFELMNASKIGSKGTYHKCLKDLDAWEYLDYFPSNNAYKGSSIRMKVFCSPDITDSSADDPVLEKLARDFSIEQANACTDFEPALDSKQTTIDLGVNHSYTGSEQASVSGINNNKQANYNKLPNDRQAVLNFFKANNFEKEEGDKFLEFYQQNNWKTGDGCTIRDWQAVALNWMERAFKKSGSKKLVFKDHLKIQKEKNYDQPL